jgi:non-specific serine/threonine protein kinase
VVPVLAVVAAVVGWGGGGWRTDAPLPVPRTEVAAAVGGGRVVVAGGYLADGTTTGRVDLYDPAAGRWRQGPALPRAVNHASAATLDGEAVVVGGYVARGTPSTLAVALEQGRWRSLPTLVAPRAAAAAAVLGGRLYVVGGVTNGGLARRMLVYDGRGWKRLPGPTPRQHLAAAAAGGRIYAIAGRVAGADTNLAIVESWAPGETRWRREPPLPEARGGTSAAAIEGRIVSIGSESQQKTSGAVFAFDLRRRRWTRIPDLPTPRHGLGVVVLGGRVHAVGGGPEPGLTVTGANESLRVGSR